MLFDTTDPWSPTMSALVIPAGSTPIVLHRADLWEPCCECGIVHHETLTTVPEDVWWPGALPGRRRRFSIRNLFSH